MTLLEGNETVYQIWLIPTERMNIFPHMSCSKERCPFIWKHPRALAQYGLQTLTDVTDRWFHTCGSYSQSSPKIIVYSSSCCTWTPFVHLQHTQEECSHAATVNRDFKLVSVHYSDKQLCGGHLKEEKKYYG